MYALGIFLFVCLFGGGGGLVVLVFYLGLLVVFKILGTLTCFLFEGFCFFNKFTQIHDR